LAAFLAFFAGAGFSSLFSSFDSSPSSLAAGFSFAFGSSFSSVFSSASYLTLFLGAFLVFSFSPATDALEFSSSSAAAGAFLPLAFLLAFFSYSSAFSI